MVSIVLIDNTACRHKNGRCPRDVSRHQTSHCETHASAKDDTIAVPCRWRQFGYRYDSCKRIMQRATRRAREYTGGMSVMHLGDGSGAGIHMSHCCKNLKHYLTMEAIDLNVNGNFTVEPLVRLHTSYLPRTTVKTDLNYRK